MRRDASTGIQHEGQIGRAIFFERRGNADENGLSGIWTLAADERKVGRGKKVTCADKFFDIRRRDVPDVAATGVERADFFRVNVQTDDTDAAARELQRERQADVAEADDGDGHGVSLPELRAAQKCFYAKRRPPLESPA